MTSPADPAADPPADPDSSTGRAHLFNDRNIEHYRHCVAAGVQRVTDTLARTDRPVTGVSAEALQPAVSAVDLEDPLGDTAAALDELEHVYLRDAVHFHHPHYLAHLNCPVVIPALLGETVLSSINSSLDTWDQSAGGTLIERRLVDWTAQRLGLGEHADGVFTSGGTQSNLQALLMARDEACRRARRGATGPRTAEILPRLRILASEASHFSVAKSASLLGLGREAVISVPCDAQRQMQTVAAGVELDRCRREGLIPMAVVATAGTTDFGTIDPLTELANLCRDSGVWLHVDAAYGCGLLVSRRRALLEGIEHADSVTVDYHKSFFQPVSSSAVLVRDRTSLRHVTYHADYLNPARNAEAGIPNQVDKSIQTTRRFDALKLWLTLRIMGPDAVGELFDAVIDRAAQGWRLLADDPRFEVVTEPQLSTLVFRYLPEGADAELCDEANLHARSALFSAGQVAVASTVVDGRHYLKFTVLNPETTLRDLAEVLDLIAEHAGSYAACRADPQLSHRRAS